MGFLYTLDLVFPFEKRVFGLTMYTAGDSLIQTEYVAFLNRPKSFLVGMRLYAAAWLLGENGVKALRQGFTPLSGRLSPVLHVEAISQSTAVPVSVQSSTEGNNKRLLLAPVLYTT